ncbi:hypothetical protein [Tahibacter sp.]|uniref:hypothetical protein n=1 Tax=Tahibacter sp. TaxID=2056211 RepID=UPI0028C5071C|nr:hypothetical protein [Tahibacter sp.]
MSMPKAIRPKLSYDRISLRNAGLQMEISATIDGMVYPLLRILADEDDESFWLEVHTGEHHVQIPLEQVRRMIEDAPGTVFSEAQFDRENPAG